VVFSLPKAKTLVVYARVIAAALPALAHLSSVMNIEPVCSNNK
jgi:hypothetical protein